MENTVKNLFFFNKKFSEFKCSTEYVSYFSCNNNVSLTHLFLELDLC